jgi:formyltetrahydrofolate deformylase
MTTAALPEAPAPAGVQPPAAITRLLVFCPDRPGIVAAIAQFLHGSGANIVSSNQHTTDPSGGSFFLRMEFNLPMTEKVREQFEHRFQASVAGPYQMQWSMWDTARSKRIAVFVSRYDHCLLDLLWRHRRGELDASIELVVSNHPNLREDVESFGVPFVHVPVEKGKKAEAEARQLELLGNGFDLVVMARYMQILSGEFLDAVGAPVINIHHSFLPAFAGAGPYQKAKDRGVKLVGATAHYATAELDAGPIIEQDVIRVSHVHSAATLEELGADIERTVFARAVRWHCEDRVLVHGNTTVVF